MKIIKVLCFLIGWLLSFSTLAHEGATEQSYALHLDNSSQEKKKVYIVSDHFILENVEYFYKSKREWKIEKSGWGLPLNQRMIPSYLHVFTLDLPPRTQETVYFKVSNRYQITKLPLSIMSESQFIAYYHKVLLMDGMVLVALLTSIFFSIYNLIIRGSIEKIHWYYLTYGASLLIFYFIRVLLSSFIQNPIPASVDYLSEVIVFIAIYSFLRFAVEFVNTEVVKEHLQVRRIIDGLLVLTIIVTMNPSWAGTFFVNCIQLSFFLLTIIYHAVYLLLSYRKNRLAKVYIIMALPLVVSSLLEGLNNMFGIINMSGELFEVFRVSIVLEMLFILFALIYRDTYISKKLETSLEKAKLKLSNAQIEIQESEQKRIAEDLHDDLGGTLMTFKRFVFDKVLPLASKEDEKQLKFLAQKASSDLRRISRSLMPPDFEKTGLVDSVKELASINSVPGRSISTKEYGSPQKLTTEMALHIFRIVSEVVQNINKHSSASKVLIQFLWSENELTMMVEDNGSQFEENSEGLGMKNMRMRALYLQGNISFDYNENGSTIILEIPLP